MSNVENEVDVLGFNPEDLFSNGGQTSGQSTSNSLIYHTKPSESKSEDGVYRAKIKVIYNPENPKQSFLEQQSYGMKDKDGFFSVVSSLTNGDKSCPIFTAWKKCHFSDEGSVLYKQALTKDKGGNGLFDKRFARYAIVQILKDKNQPELVGSFKLWKLPTSIYTLLQQKMQPSKESGKMPIPVMDYLFGRAINIEVLPGPDDKQNPLRKTREITYQGELTEDVVSCVNPDGSPLLNDSEQEILDSYVSKISKAWKMTCEDEDDEARRNEIIKKAKESDEYKELLKIYKRVLDDIKQWAPKLDQLSYKPWTDDVKNRVDRWIKIVLDGHDPETYVGEGELQKDREQQDDAAQPANADNGQKSTVEVKDEDPDDLPF